MNKEILRKYLPYIVAVVVFAVLSCIYCSPVFQGKELYAGDNVRFKEAVHESSKYHQDTGNYTWWTGSMFAGMPNYQIGGGHYRSEDFIKPLKRLLRPSHNTRLPMVLMLYFCCFFVLLRSVGIDRWLAIVGALATGYSSYFYIIEPAGHHTKAWSIALMAVVAAGFFFIFRKKYGLGASLTMIFTSIGFSPHPQMAYYVFMLIGVIYVAELYIHIKEKRYKDLAIGTAIFAVSVLIGIGTGSAGVFANSEYVKETMRGGHSDIASDDASNASSSGLSLDYMTQWSYGIDESLTFMIPGFMGNASGYDVGTNSVLYKQLTAQGVSRSQAKDFCQQAPTYWGEQPFTAGPVYAGAAVCFLFILGLLLVKGPYKWAILVATFFSFALSWGKNWMWLTEFFYNWFPMYGKFRSVSSILIVAEMTVPLLGFMAIKQIMDGNVKREELNRSIYVSAGITGGLCLIFALFGGSLFSFVSSNDASLQSQLPDWAFAAIIDERASILRSDSFRSFVFILLSAGVIWLFANDKLKKQWMIAALGIIVVADMWPVDKRFFNDSNFVSPKQFQSSFTTLPYEKAIMADTDPHFRVMNLATSTFNDSRTSYNLKSLGGYSAAKLRRYQDIIDVYLSKVNINVVSMLNGKYLITQDEDGNVVPMRNPGALGNAWYVSSLVNANTPVDECTSIGSVDLANTIVVGDDFKQYVADFKPAAQGSEIQLTSYAPDVLTYKSQSSSDGTVVFSEIFYPYGWKAYIDGKPADIFRANYLLRAMNIPAGQHDIRMEFRPDSIRKGTTISIICIMIMYAAVLGLIAGTLVKRGRQRKSA
ncbi:MAG: YfhO family protein [Bacteroidaceae bacterium]|nr:YfhO family protein [Bacteroidaceae bacterium]